jgi:hypothetical protein
MNQNNNRTSGEKGDSYSLTYKDSTAPKVSTVLGSLFGATIVFTEAINPTTLTASMLHVRNTATGKLVTNLEVVPTFDAARFHILVDADAGAYEVDLDPGVKDLFGNRMSTGQKATFTIDPPEIGNRTRELMDVVRMTRDDRFAAGIFLEDWADQFLPSENSLPDDSIPPFDPIDPSIMSGIPLFGIDSDVIRTRIAAIDSIFAERGREDVLRPGNG